MRHFLQHPPQHILKPWLLIFLVFLLIIFFSCNATRNNPQINYSQLKDLLVQGQVAELTMAQDQSTVELNATVQLNEGAEVTLLGQGPEQIRTDITVVNVRMPKDLNEDLIWALKENDVKYHSAKYPMQLDSLLSILPVWITIFFIGFIIFITFSVVVKKSPIQFDFDFGQLSPTEPKN